MVCALLALALLQLAPSASGQSSTSLNHGLGVTWDGTAFNFTWWGRDGFTYFVEQSEDLTEWDYVPTYRRPTSDGIDGIAITTNAERLFLRVLLSDDPSWPLLGEDFDSDGINNGDEIDHSMNPFVAEAIVDSDTDGLADYWENFHFTNLSRNGDGDFDNDGIIDRFEWQSRTSPTSDQTTAGAAGYLYNSLGQLTAVSGPLSLGFFFDLEGNITSAQ